MSKKNRPQNRKQNLVEQELDGEVLIYDLESNKAFCLNQTSALVWQACDGKRTVAQINDLLGKQLQTQTDEDIVWLALDQLSKEKLIDPAVDVGTKFEGLSRREIIKKIGLGSMVALPVVASLVAPTSAFAQTCVPPVGLPLGTVCAQSCQCTIMCCCTIPPGNPSPGTECRTVAVCTAMAGTCATF